jgi:hypothetical protein
MDRIQMGGAEITRVIEWRGPIRTVAEIFPDTPSRVWQDNDSWLSQATAPASISTPAKPEPPAVMS